MNSIETLLNYVKENTSRNGLPVDIQTAIERIKRSKLYDDGYFVHADALPNNYVIGGGSDAEESAESVASDLGLEREKENDLDARTLNEWLGL